MIISLIAAVTKNNVIGKDNDLPWKLPDDMKYFMETTKGHAVIMGRKNYESLPPKFRPLKERFNIVISHSYEDPDVRVVSSMDSALDEARKNSKDDEIFVIGGAQIYNLAMPVANRLYITEIDAVLQGDTYFPSFDRNQWKEVSRKHHAADDRHLYAFDFVIYERPNFS